MHRNQRKERILAARALFLHSERNKAARLHAPRFACKCDGRNPVQHTRCGNRRAAVFHPALRVRRARRADNEQPLFSACKRDIENSRLLRRRFGLLLCRNGLREHRVALCAQVRVDCGRGCAQLIVHAQHALAAAAHEAVARAGHKHNRVLQALALVNRRQADDVLIVGERAAFHALALRDAFHHAQKTAQTAGALLLEFSGKFSEHPKTILALRAVLARARLGVNPRFVVNAIDQPFQRQHAGILRPARKARIKVPKRFAQRVASLLHIRLHRRFKRALGRHLADARQHRVVQPERGAAQRREQGNILLCVVHHAQHGEHRQHLRLGEQILTHIGHGGKAVRVEHVDHLRRPPAHRAHEDCDIAQAQRRILRHELFDAARDHFRFLPRFRALDGGELVVVRLVLPGVAAEQQHFRLDAHRPLRHADGKLLVLRILQLHRAAGKDAPEHIVDGVKQRRVGAEIRIERQLAVFRAGRGVKRAQLFQKQLRRGQPEAVDALLHIAHEEQVALAAHARKQRLLQKARILILVDEHVAILFAHIALHGLVAQRLKRARFQIGKIQHAACRFFFSEFGMIAPHRVHNAGEDELALAKPLHGGFRAAQRF